ncbi:MAG: cation:proton antiporter [Candidatus Methylomirabilales bacterium]
MQSFGFLRDLVLVFAVSTLVVWGFHKLRQSAVVGFLTSGVLIGPYGLSLIHDLHQVELLAEIGVVLLLFTIGLEFSFSTLSQMRRLVFGGGGLQVVGTILLTAGAFWLIGLGPPRAVFFGFLLALSSTAIVLKILMERGEIDSPQGRFAVGILLFQDLCVVPMMLIAPLLAGMETSAPTAVVWALGKAAITVAIILLLSRLIVPRFLFQIAKLRSPELFLISIILICLGTAWATSQIGLSLALGAFLAGMVIADSEYSHQALANILPFRDSLSSLFFISVGMLMDARSLLEHPAAVFGMLVAILIGKAAVAGGAVLILGYPVRIAALVGLTLAQVGEFSFVLSRMGLHLGLLTPGLNQIFLSASVISMVLTPLVVQWSPRAAPRAARLGRLQRWFPGKAIGGVGPKEVPLQNHVIIIGYGPTGRQLSQVLRATEIPYCILELNGQTVRRAREQGEPIYYGDVAGAGLLERLGIERAKLLVVAISDPTSIRRAVRLAREANPRLFIVARTRYLVELDELYRLGADEVVAEEFEASIELFAHVLHRYHLPQAVIGRHVEEFRRERYDMLRQLTGARLPLSDAARIFARVDLETYLVEEGRSGVGKTIGQLELRRRTGASVVAVIRDGHIMANPGPGAEIRVGDVLVLMGSREQVERAMTLLSVGLSQAGSGK